MIDTDTAKLGTVAAWLLRSQFESIHDLQPDAENAAVEAGGRLVGSGVVADADEVVALYGDAFPAGTIMVKWQMVRAT